MFCYSYSGIGRDGIVPKERVLSLSEFKTLEYWVHWLICLCLVLQVPKVGGSLNIKADGHGIGMLQVCVPRFPLCKTKYKASHTCG